MYCEFPPTVPWGHGECDKQFSKYISSYSVEMYSDELRPWVSQSKDRILFLLIFPLCVQHVIISLLKIHLFFLSFKHCIEISTWHLFA